MYVFLCMVFFSLIIWRLITLLYQVQVLHQYVFLFIAENHPMCIKQLGFFSTNTTAMMYHVQVFVLLNVCSFLELLPKSDWLDK